MSVNVDDLLENVQKLNVNRETLIAIGKTSTQMAELNREQLREGKQSDGQNMPPYSWVSVHKFFKPEGPIRLFDTGAFHNSIQVDVGSDEFQFIAEDRYNLFERYGENNILGLTDRQQEYYNEEIFLPVFAEQVENQTGLKFD